MKCYNWINSYTAGGQNAPIQIAHAQVGMIKNFLDRPEIHEFMEDKTTVVLKGGNHKAMTELAGLLEMGYIPWYAFRESMDAGNGIMTCVGCLPTDRLINAAAALRQVGKSNVIWYDNSLVIGVRSDGSYFGIDKRYRDMMTGNIHENFDNHIDRVRSCVETETFTPWETELIKIISEGRTA